MLGSVLSSVLPVNVHEYSQIRYDLSDLLLLHAQPKQFVDPEIPALLQAHH